MWKILIGRIILINKMKDFYLVVFKNGETKKFKDRTSVVNFLEKQFNLTSSQIKMFFQKRSKLSRKYGIEILKLTWERKSPCKKHRSLMFYPKIIWRTGFTDIEERVFEGLKKLGFKEDKDFIVQYPVMGKNGSKYILDFAFPKEKLNIECDGEYWHEKCKNIDEDKKRDEFLRNRGWHILRFNGKEIKENLPKVLETIRSEVEKLRSKQ